MIFFNGFAIEHKLRGFFFHLIFIYGAASYQRRKGLVFIFYRLFQEFRLVWGRIFLIAWVWHCTDNHIRCEKVCLWRKLAYSRLLFCSSSVRCNLMEECIFCTLERLWLSGWKDLWWVELFGWLEREVHFLIFQGFLWFLEVKLFCMCLFLLCFRIFLLVF